jgi:hypothetical protein
MDYKSNDEYFAVVQKARTVCQEYAEERAFSSSPTGAIFLLKQYGFRDDAGRPGILIINNDRSVPADRRERLSQLLSNIYSTPQRSLPPARFTASLNPDDASHE